MKARHLAACPTRSGAGANGAAVRGVSEDSNEKYFSQRL